LLARLLSVLYAMLLSLVTVSVILCLDILVVIFDKMDGLIDFMYLYL